MDVEPRVADQLEEDRLGLLVDRPAEGRRIGAVDVGRRDADLRQGVGEQVVRAAVERRRRDDVVAGPGEVEDRQRLGRLAGGDAEGRDAALERGDALLEDVGRRVHDPGVDVPELLEPEQPRGVRGVIEDVARGGVDRDGPGVRRRVGLLAASGGPGSPGGRWSDRVRPCRVRGALRCGAGVSLGANKKTAAPLWSPRPRDRSVGPAAYVISDVRVTSDPILPRRGRLRIHMFRSGRCQSRSGMVAKTIRDSSTVATETQPSRAGAGRRLRAMTRHPRRRSAPTSPRRSSRRRARSSAASASSPRPTCRPGEVEVRVGWSSVNYKDGLATRADGKVAPDQPAHPRHRPGRRGRRQRRSGLRGRRRRPGPRLRAGRARGTAATASTSACRPAGSCRWRPGLTAARRDGDRDGRVHRGDVRRRARGARPAAGRRAGARDRCEWRRRRHGARDPRRARLRGLGGDRQARRGGAADRRWARPGS